MTGPQTTPRCTQNHWILHLNTPGSRWRRGLRPRTPSEGGLHPLDPQLMWRAAPRLEPAAFGRQVPKPNPPLSRTPALFPQGFGLVDPRLYTTAENQHPAA